MADDSSSSDHTKKKKKSKKNKEDKHKETKSAESQGNDASNSASLKRKSDDSSQDEVLEKKVKVELANGVSPSVTKTPKRTGNNWSHEQEKELLEKVGEHIAQLESSRDPKKPVFLKQIDWKQIKVGNFEMAEISAKFHLLSNRVRKLRTAMEIITDMKQLPEGRGRKQHKEADPLLPKKPLSSYFQFCNEKRGKLHERHPKLHHLELSSKLGKKWNKLSDEKKKKYVDRYQEENEEYQVKLIEYLKDHNPNITPPKDAFELWAEEEKKNVEKEFPDISERKTKKKLKRRWKEVDEGEKANCEKKAKLELKRFRARVNSAKKKATKQPNSD